MASFTASDLAERLAGTLVGDPSLAIMSFAPADSAKPGDLTFAENDSFFARADQSAASAILVAGDYVSTTGKVLIRVANARIAFAQVLPLFFPEPVFSPGVHASAMVASSATIDPS